jgi:hypothetical protein
MALLAALLGCADPAPDELEPDFEIVTERLVLHGYDRSEDQLCGGTLDWMDGYVDSLAPYFDLEPGVIGEYRWYSSALWEELTPCGSGAGCVTFDDGSPIAWAPIAPFEHEIAHMTSTHCIPILMEGLAEFLRGGSEAPSGMVGGVPLEHTIDASFWLPEWNKHDYQNARHFVSFLAHEYGLKAAADLCRAAPFGTDEVGFDAAIREVLGTSFEELVTAYQAYPVCPEEQDRAKVFECGREPDFVVGPGTVGDAYIDVDCDDLRSVGSRDGYFSMSYSVRLLESATYSFGFRESDAPLDGASFRLEQCASCGDGARAMTYEWTSDYVVELDEYPAGDYAMELRFPGEFTGTVRIALLYKW